MIIKRIGPVSCAKISATLYAVIGLFIGAGISLIALAGGFATQTSQAAGIGALMGVAAIVVCPIVYGTLGFLGALVMAALYNVLAGIMGGVVLDVQ
jgi:hypothetical protein